MDYQAANPMCSALNAVLHYCEQHGLPPLTVLVVNREGVPGGGFRLTDAASHYAQQEAVFGYSWFKLIPPTVEDFQHATAWHKARPQEG